MLKRRRLLRVALVIGGVMGLGGCAEPITPPQEFREPGDTGQVSEPNSALDSRPTAEQPGDPAPPSADRRAAVNSSTNAAPANPNPSGTPPATAPSAGRPRGYPPPPAEPPRQAPTSPGASGGSTGQQFVLEIDDCLSLAQTLPTGTAVGFNLSYRWIGTPPTDLGLTAVAIRSRNGDTQFLPVQFDRRGGSLNFFTDFRPDAGPFQIALGRGILQEGARDPEFVPLSRFRNCD